MRFKKYIKSSAVRIFLHLKNLGISFFVPLIIMDVVIPILNYLVYAHYGIGDRLYTSILQYSLWFMPLASVWWPIFTMRDYIEGDGSELLYVNQNSSRLLDTAYLFIISLLNILIIFAVYTRSMPHMKYEFLRVLCVCILYFGIVYAVGFLTKSTTLTILLSVLYALVSLYLEKGKDTNILIYVSTETLTEKVFVSDYLPLAAIGLGLAILGVFLNRRKLDFYSRT